MTDDSSIMVSVANLTLDFTVDELDAIKDALDLYVQAARRGRWSPRLSDPAGSALNKLVLGLATLPEPPLGEYISVVDQAVVAPPYSYQPRRPEADNKVTQVEMPAVPSDPELLMAMLNKQNQGVK